MEIYKCFLGLAPQLSISLFAFLKSERVNFVIVTPRVLGSIASLSGPSVKPKETSRL